ncbi:MAG: hypothetical protein MJ252_20415 [archaeon]|nr:hypothetical protein [archaeon]
MNMKNEQKENNSEYIKNINTFVFSSNLSSPIIFPSKEGNNPFYNKKSNDNFSMTQNKNNNNVLRKYSNCMKPKSEKLKRDSSFGKIKKNPSFQNYESNNSSNTNTQLKRTFSSFSNEKKIENFLNRQDYYSRKQKENQNELQRKQLEKLLGEKSNAVKMMKENFDNMYEKNTALQNQRKELNNQKYEQNLSQTCKQFRQTEYSSKILSNLYIKAFTTIFKILDEDQDGLISPISITKSFKSLPQNVRKILDPIISELKEGNYTLNQNEFIVALCELYKDLSLDEKNIIAGFERDYKRKRNKSRENIHNEFTFKPKINKRSRSLAINHEQKLLIEMNKKNLIPKKKYHKTISDFF